MNLEQKDKYVSSIILLLTFAMIFYLISNSGGSLVLKQRTIIDIWDDLINNYIDLILIFYIFICFQIAGFLELKYKKNFILTSLLSIVFTPICLFFTMKDDNNND